ncbi:serine/threonine-protein kinase [Streptomyces avermitilis]|uniref:serine/threonine-protein kinase n=1 Tax=Streptomyces avermitilis TaxID=33903 RepID=UPI0033B25443
MAGETPEQGEGRIINGRYRLLRTLGAGGMGRVWLAYDAELACEVAVKEIALPDMPIDASEPVQRIARARSEARNAARLRGHPHVATVHDVVVHEGLPWIVMEYVPDAIDLQAVVRRSGPLTPAQTARIGVAVLDALTAGHRIGILHRDVKPANILLAPDASGDPYARVLLTDYGIALRPESREPRLTATAGILGTPGYLAPERARGEPPTPAADLFSLGATLYATVEGRGPFDRHGEYATLTALLGEEPTPPVRAGELGAVLHGLLIKDPVRRLAPEAVARGLETVARAAPGEGFGPPPAWGSAPSVGQGFGPPPQGFGPPPDGFGPPSTTPSVSPPSAEVATTAPGAPRVSAPGTPQTPGAPRTPQTPHTPQTPAGGPGTPPGSPSAYNPWRQTPPSGLYDPGNPYASSPSSPYAGTGAPAAYEGGPAYSPPRPASRRKSAAALVAIVVAAALVLTGGIWAALSLTGGPAGDAGGTKGHQAKKSPPASGPRSTKPAGPVLPYGEQVGLTEPLQAGDCVRAVWSGAAFKSVPNLGVVDCADDWPDGQVVAVDTAADYADARDRGARRCAGQSQATADALPDAGVYAVAPTKEGFTAARGGTACLVLGRHAAIGGEVGRFRDTGTDLWVGQMSIGDCWIYKEEKDSYKAPLSDCAQPHTDQVIGAVSAPKNMDYKKGVDNGNKLCGNKFESSWAPGPARQVFGWVADKEDWNDGFDKVVCTVRRADGAETSGKIAAPGAV